MEKFKIKTANRYVLLKVHNADVNPDKCIVRMNESNEGELKTYDELVKLLDKYNVTDNIWFYDDYQMYCVELLDEDLKERA